MFKLNPNPSGAFWNLKTNPDYRLRIVYTFIEANPHLSNVEVAEGVATLPYLSHVKPIGRFDTMLVIRKLYRLGYLVY
jgi:hypothetical protein